MVKDFIVGQSNELLQGERVFDLHNLYDFSGLSIGADRSVQVFFAPNSEHGTGQPPVELEFRDVDYFALSPGFGTRVSSDLDEIGYMNPDQDDDQWLLGEDQATRSDHLLFRLGADSIRIHAESARLRLHT